VKNYPLLWEFVLGRGLRSLSALVFHVFSLSSRIYCDDKASDVISHKQDRSVSDRTARTWQTNNWSSVVVVVDIAVVVVVLLSQLFRVGRCYFGCRGVKKIMFAICRTEFPQSGISPGRATRLTRISSQIRRLLEKNHFRTPNGEMDVPQGELKRASKILHRQNWSLTRHARVGVEVGVNFLRASWNGVKRHSFTFSHNEVRTAPAACAWTSDFYQGLEEQEQV